LTEAVAPSFVPHRVTVAAKSAASYATVGPDVFCVALHISWSNCRYLA